MTTKLFDITKNKPFTPFYTSRGSTVVTPPSTSCFDDSDEEMRREEKGSGIRNVLSIRPP